jgi:hypothetical protein
MGVERGGPIADCADWIGSTEVAPRIVESDGACDHCCAAISVLRPRQGSGFSAHDPAGRGYDDPEFWPNFIDSAFCKHGLRSVALAHDGEHNTEAVRMLERSVGLDPTFAPAWSALGKRYYDEEEYGAGATASMRRADPTLRRALALDQEAKAMVEKRPQSGIAHFTLSYVLRYASVSKEPKTSAISSCGSLRAITNSIPAPRPSCSTGSSTVRGIF